MMKKSVMILCALLLAGGMTVAWSVQQAQRALADKVVRLHVLANSDSEEDQQVKLAVRDVILSAVEKKLVLCTNQKQAEKVVRDALPELEEIAREALAIQGYPYDVSAVISREIYPQRSYENFSLPAGEYLSLRVIIGEGAGKNWWCVVFPPLCLAATAEEVVKDAKQAGFGENEIALITAENNRMLVRFKILDLLSQWMDS